MWRDRQARVRAKDSPRLVVTEGEGAEMLAVSGGTGVPRTADCSVIFHNSAEKET